MLKPDLSKAVAGQVSWWLWVTASVCWRKSTILGLVVEQYSNRNYLLHRKLKLKCQRSTPWSGHGTPPVWHSSISRGRNGESESLKYNVCNWNNHNLDKKYIWRVRRPRSAKLCGSSRSTITYCRSNPRMKIRTASPTRFDHLKPVPDNMDMAMANTCTLLSTTTNTWHIGKWGSKIRSNPKACEFPITQVSILDESHGFKVIGLLISFPWSFSWVVQNCSIYYTTILGPTVVPLGPRTQKASEMLQKHQTLLQALEISDRSAPARVYAFNNLDVDNMCTCTFMIWRVYQKYNYKEQVSGNNGLCHRNERDAFEFLSFQVLRGLILISKHQRS